MARRRLLEPLMLPNTQDDRYEFASSLLQGLGGLASASIPIAETLREQKKREREMREKQLEEMMRKQQEFGLYGQLGANPGLASYLTSMQEGPIKKEMLRQLTQGKLQQQSWGEYLGTAEPMGIRALQYNLSPETQAAYSALGIAQPSPEQMMQAPQQPSAPSIGQVPMEQQQVQLGVPQPRQLSDVQPQERKAPSKREIDTIVAEAARAGRTIPEQVQLMRDRGQLNESTARWAVRNAARLSSRGAEAVIETVPNIAAAGAEFLANRKRPAGGLFMDVNKPVSEVEAQYKKTARERAQEAPIEVPRLDIKKSVSDELEKRYLPKDFLQPQNETERNLDEWASTAGALLAPFPGSSALKIGKGSIELARNVGRAMGIAGAGQIAKWGAKTAGFSDNAQDWIKLGAMAITGMIGPKVAERLGGAQMKKGAQELTGIEIKGNKLTPFVHEYQSGISRGKFKPDTQLTNQYNSLFGGIENIPINKRDINHFALPDLLDMRQNLNRFAREAGKGSSRKFASSLKKPLDEAIRAAGQRSKDAMEAINTYFNGAELYKASKEISKVSKFLDKALTARRVISASGQLGVGGIFTGLGLKPAVATGIAAGAARGIVSPVLNNALRLFKYPSVRNLYGKVITNIMAKNYAQADKNFKQLQKEVERRKATI